MGDEMLVYSSAYRRAVERAVLPLKHQPLAKESYAGEATAPSTSAAEAFAGPISHRTRSEGSARPWATAAKDIRGTYVPHADAIDLGPVGDTGLQRRRYQGRVTKDG